MAKENNNALYRWMILFTVVIGTFMSILDSSIVNIAISKLMAVFGASLDDVKWILTAYTLVLGAVIPLTGYLGEVLGTKRVYVFALSVFTIGSFLCGFAWSNSTMIVFRIIQAIGGGMIMPVGMSILMEVFEAEERGVAFGFWGIASMAAPALGPTLGGYIIEKLDWRLIFYVNVPVGIIGIIFAILLLKSPEMKPIKNFDYIGFLTSAVGLISILYVLGEGSTIDWGDLKNPILMTLGCFSLVMFVANERMHSNPLVDLSVFKILDFSISQLIVGITTFALISGVYVIPLFLQNLRAYTAFETGIIMLPAAIATGIMMPVSGKIFDKFGVKPVVIPGLIILIASSYYLAFINLNSSKEWITAVLTIRGLGLGLCMMPVNTAGLNAVPDKLSGNASAINNTIRQVTSSLSVTIMTTVINNQLHYGYSKMSEQVTSFNPQATSIFKQLQGLLSINGYSSVNAKNTATYVFYGTVFKQAYVTAMEYAIAITAVVAATAIVAVMFMHDKNEPVS